MICMNEKVRAIFNNISHVIGVTDDALALIYQANKKNNVAVNTPAGLTDREEVQEIVLQGEVFGPLQCSVQVDTFGKECLSEEKHLYQYRNCIGIPPLAMIDDLLSISECGVESVKSNAFLNSKTNIKKLQFGGEKCYKLHIGKKKHLCPELHVDSWKLQKKDEKESGIKNLKDVFDGDFKMESKEDVKYLGDIITTDGTNVKNVESRRAKASGAVKQILSILEEICFGPFYFEIAMVLRNSLLVSSLLTNSEAWYGLTKHDVDTLESADLLLLRRIFEVPFSCPKEMFYLETGCLPLSYIIIIRRLIFYHSILHEDQNSLIYNFLQSQTKCPVKGDWILDVQKNLSELGITESEDQIRTMSKFRFQAKVRKAVRHKALYDLLKLKNTHSKVKHINYSELEMQVYLKSELMSNHEAKFLFHSRSRMLPVKSNYGNSFTDNFCPLCKKNLEDTQTHLLVCDSLNDQNVLATNVPQYDHLFSSKVEDQVVIVKILKKKLEKRKKLLKTKS